MADVNATKELPIPSQYKEAKASMLIRQTLFVLFTLASITGNSIVIRSIIMIPYKRPLTYILVTNLALAELINTLLLPAIQVYDQLNTWPFGAFLCHVISPLQIAMGLVITWTIVLIAFHRYRTLQSPSMEQRRRTSHKIILMVCLWTISFGLAIPFAVHTVLIQSPYNGRDNWCLTLFDGDSLSSYPLVNKINLARFIVNFCVPVLLMVAFYGAMAVRLKYHMARVGPLRLTAREAQTTSSTKEGNATLTSNDLGLQPRPMFPSDSLRSTRSIEMRIYIQDDDLLRMIYVVVVIFIVCYIPYQVFYMLEHYNVLTINAWYYHHVTRRYLFLFTCLPSALHPLCYGTISKFYAKMFSCVFLCKWFRKRRS